MVRSVFPSLPEDIQKWPKWLAQIGQKALGHTIPVRNADGHHERVSLYALFVFGRYWNLDENIWPAADADFGQLTADAILAHYPGMPVPVQQQFVWRQINSIFSTVKRIYKCK